MKLFPKKWFVGLNFKNINLFWFKLNFDVKHLLRIDRTHTLILTFSSSFVCLIYCIVWYFNNINQIYSLQPSIVYRLLIWDNWPQIYMRTDQESSIYALYLNPFNQFVIHQYDLILCTFKPNWLSINNLATWNNYHYSG